MSLQLPPQSGQVLDSAATMVELLTLANSEGPRAATRRLDTLDDATARAVAHMMLGSLYAAVIIQAEMLGVDPAFVIRTLGLNVATTPRRDQ